MKREEKTIIINNLAEKLQQFAHFYVADIEALNAEKTAQLRKECFDKEVQLMVVKNTLLTKALESVGKADAELVATLKGNTSVFFTNTGNVPAKLIKEFRKSCEKPIIKAAYIDECTYVGDCIDTLCAIKSKEELLGDIVGLLQSPAKNVISALQSSGQTISGLVKTLSEREQ